MNLREVISQYRESHHMSRREFGRKCGLSNAYISILETGVNPRTGEPLSPTLETYQKIASAMGITLNTLLSMLSEDVLITLNAPYDDEDPARKQLIEFVENLPDEQLDLYLTLSQYSTEKLQAIVDLLK